LKDEKEGRACLWKRDRPFFYQLRMKKRNPMEMVKKQSDPSIDERLQGLFLIDFFSNCVNIFLKLKRFLIDTILSCD
jgi:hypothetical protein